MISKRITSRKDGKSSAAAALTYGEGLTPDRKTGEVLDKSHRTRLGNFGLVDDGVYIGRDAGEMAELISIAAMEMQDVCDLNTRVGLDKKMGHFVVSFNQYEPSEAVLRDTEDSMLAAMKLDQNHFASFLHNDNGYWHLHIFASRIEKEWPHRGNPLWHDQINRDKVCREIEVRHGLQRDNGLHVVDKEGKIVEIPRAERKAKREAKPADISDKAKTTEIYSGERSFQTWCNDFRIGDRLKHAKSWQDLHAAAAAYKCEIRPKGNGYVICPTGEKGGIQLSKVGLKNLSAKFGAFEAAKEVHRVQEEQTYKPAPTQEKAQSHYAKWRAAKDAFKPILTDRINEQRDAHKLARTEIRLQQKAELAKIRAETPLNDRFSAISIAKMQHTVALAALTDQFARDRQALRKQLAGEGPGNTFRDYLVIAADGGDNIALGLARKYGTDASTKVLCEREVDQLKIVAAVHGQEYRPALRLTFAHHIERNGTVVYDFGNGRKMTDSAIAKQVQLNDAAANSPEAIATALSFATTKFGNTLTLTGSAEFQRRAVEIAVIKRLGIKFADPALEAYREKFAAEQHINKEKHHAPNFRNKLTRQIPPPHRRSNSMLDLSSGDLVLDTERDVGALRKNVPDRMEQPQERLDHGMQRAATGVAGAGRITIELPSAANAGKRAANVGVVRASGWDGTGKTSKRSRLPVDGFESSNKAGRQAQRAAASVAEVPTVNQQPAPAEAQPLSAHAWLAKWAKDESKSVTGAISESANVAYAVLYIADDGVVLNKGRSGAVYAMPTDLDLKVGAQVVVGRNAELQLARVAEQGVGKNELGR